MTNVELTNSKANTNSCQAMKQGQKSARTERPLSILGSQKHQSMHNIAPMNGQHKGRNGSNFDAELHLAFDVDIVLCDIGL